MKKILLLLILNIPLLVMAQKTPDFLAELYFEDAIGNKDTLWVGYDSETDYKTIDFELGEDTILRSALRDTIFEVRAEAGARFNNNSYYQTTVILQYSNCKKYYLENPILIEVVIAHPPLKVSWNKSVWAEEFCTKRSFIQPNLIGPLLNIWDDLTYFAEQDSVFFTAEQMFWKFDLENGATVRDMYIEFIPGKVATTDVQIDNSLQLYPNPARNRLTIELPSDVRGEQIKLFDLSGRLVYELVLASGDQKIELNVQHLPKGIYTCSIIFETGEVVSQKWVKLE